MSSYGIAKGKCIDDSLVEENIELHDKNYPLLIGKVRKDAKINNRIMKSIKGEKIGQEQIPLTKFIK